MKFIARMALGAGLMLVAATGFAQTKVTFWYGLTGFNGEIVKQVVDKYNASQSKFVVEAISQPDHDATINKLNTSLAGGELPNVVQVYDIGSQRMIDTKKVTPVGDLIAKEKLDIAANLEPAVASYYTIGGASLWLTSTGSSDQQAGAWDFVKFSARPDIQAFFSSNTGYYPIRKAAYDLPEMKDALMKYPQLQVAIDQLRATAASPATAGVVFGTFVKARGNVQAAMEQFLSGKFPTAQAALDAAKKSSSELGEYNALTN